MKRWILALLLPALGGCHKELPANYADCADDDCKLAWADAHVEDTPEGVIDVVAAEPDVTTRLALVTALASQHPAQLARRCIKIPPGPARDRCDALNKRPHLWQVAIPGEVEGDDGEATVLVGLQPSESSLGIWKDVSPMEVPCKTEARVCQRQAAIAAAKGGDSRKAAAICAAVEEQRWRDECMFQAGEQAALADLAHGLELGAPLCLGAGAYAGRCLMHLTWAVAGPAPDALSGSAADWAPIIAGIAAGAEALKIHEATLAEEWHQRAWGSALRASYEQVLTVTGTPLAVLPEEARPHITAAAAWRLLKLESSQRRSLEQWGARLEEALAQTDRGQHRKREYPTRSAFSVVDRWADRTPADAAFQRVAWLGTGHRALGDDPRSERLICLLEAAAQASPPLMDLLKQGSRDRDPVVSWTARRLIPQVHGGTSQEKP